MGFLRIRQNYINNLWNKKMVADAVEQGFITELDYYAIVGEPYSKEETTEKTCILSFYLLNVY